MQSIQCIRGTCWNRSVFTYALARSVLAPRVQSVELVSSGPLRQLLNHIQSILGRPWYIGLQCSVWHFSLLSRREAFSLLSPDHLCIRVEIILLQLRLNRFGGLGEPRKRCPYRQHLQPGRPQPSGATAQLVQLWAWAAYGPSCPLLELRTRLPGTPKSALQSHDC